MLCRRLWEHFWSGGRLKVRVNSPKGAFRESFANSHCRLSTRSAGIDDRPQRLDFCERWQGGSRRQQRYYLTYTNDLKLRVTPGWDGQDGRMCIRREVCPGLVALRGFVPKRKGIGGHPCQHTSRRPPSRFRQTANPAQLHREDHSGSSYGEAGRDVGAGLYLPAGARGRHARDACGRLWRCGGYRMGRLMRMENRANTSPKLRAHGPFVVTCTFGQGGAGSGTGSVMKAGWQDPLTARRSDALPARRACQCTAAVL
jgi:hypothetical protein